jgi:hypothetical protein
MFRLTIRDLLWLMLVVAVGLGWFVHQRQLGADMDQANAGPPNGEARRLHPGLGV